MSRSPYTEIIQRVQGMITYVQENLSTDEFNLFLDLLVPEHEVETKPTPVAAAPVQRRKIQKCDACNWTKRAAVHKDPNASGYHEFQPSKSAAQSPRTAKQKTGTKGKPEAVKDLTDPCVAELPNGAGICGLGDDDMLHHDQTYGNYHEYKTAA